METDHLGRGPLEFGKTRAQYKNELKRKYLLNSTFPKSLLTDCFRFPTVELDRRSRITRNPAPSLYNLVYDKHNNTFSEKGVERRANCFQLHRFLMKDRIRGDSRDIPLKGSKADEQLDETESWHESKEEKKFVEEDDNTLDEVLGDLLDLSIAVPKKPKSQQFFGQTVSHNSLPFDFEDVVPDYAFKFPFELDLFQKQAIYHLERGESVFVSAHTSAGKTVVAEYAIALATKHMTKTIYTSPIKALSNQKYRDFKETFNDVGLLTGDIQINPEASCLIMTTEILRSMLYRGADLLRDVEFVIFDEVHYVNDSERGVVWEEVIIMLPSHVTLILLSATIPNTFEFADWVGRTKEKEIFIISTLNRPVPLEHFLFIDGKTYKVVDERRNFLTESFLEASKLAKHKLKSGPIQGYIRGEKQEKNLWLQIVNFLKKRDMIPVVIFTLSKRKCEENSNGLYNVDVTTSSEKSQIHVFLESVFAKLSEDDRQLPQILRMKEMLLRGIAVHHGGLLPIIKEAVEILFSRNLVKVLFATETFAMGVNMPARTVVFSGIRKHDGSGFRELLPGEYTQMSGRAGRRGLDPTGVVIIACSDNIPSEATLRQIMLGTPTRLKSQFRLTYNMILNLLRVQAFRVEEMMKKSFSENQTQINVPADQSILEHNESKLSSIDRLDCVICSEISDFYDDSFRLSQLTHQIYNYFFESRQLSKVFGGGRVVVVNNGFYLNCIGVVLKIVLGQAKSLKCLVCSPIQSFNAVPFTHISVGSSYDLIDLNPADILYATPLKLNLDASEERIFKELLLRTENMPLIYDLDIPSPKDVEIGSKIYEREIILSRIRQFKCISCPDFLSHFNIYYEQRHLTEQMAEIQFKLSDKNLQLLPEYHQRIKVLKEMHYIDDNSVLIKGKVACEFNTVDELITTELLFENFFGQFDAAQIVALLSCMVFQDKQEIEFELNDELEKGRQDIIEIAKRVINVQKQNDMLLSYDQVLSELRFGLVQVVYDWAKGIPFKQITEKTQVLEGSIVRCIVRLDETCREVRNAAKMIGDIALHHKMEEASQIIKRDICFASSLYY